MGAIHHADRYFSVDVSQNSARFHRVEGAHDSVRPPVALSHCKRLIRDGVFRNHSELTRCCQVTTVCLPTFSG